MDNFLKAFVTLLFQEVFIARMVAQMNDVQHIYIDLD